MGHDESRAQRLLVPRFRPGRPPLARGARTAIGIALPLLVIQLLGHPHLAVFAAVGGLMVGVTDVGASYSTKARAMTSALVLACIGVSLGTMVGVSPWIGAPLLGMWAFVFAFSVLFDASAIMVGWVATVSFLAGMGMPPAAGSTIPEELLVRPAGILIGGLWMMLLALALWPIHPYRPLTRAVAAYFRSLASLMRKATAGEGELREARAAANAAQETSSSIMRSTRLSRPTTGAVGRRLVALHAEGFRLFEETLSVAETLDSLSGGDRRTADVRDGTERFLREVAQDLAQVAEAVEAGGAPVSSDHLSVALEAAEHPIDAVESAPNTLGGADVSAIAALRPRFRYMAGVLREAAENASDLGRRADSLSDEDSGNDASLVASGGPGPLVLIRQNMTLRSAAFRHALRMGLTMVAAVALYSTLDLPKPFWVTLAVATVVKPDLGGTLDTALQTVAGTIIGCSVAAVLIALVRTDIGVTLLIIPFAFAGITLAYYNSAFFSAGIAPIFVFLSDLSELGNWKLAGLRIMNTCIGAFLGLVGGYLLWPNSERSAWKDQLAAVIRANRRYMDTVMSAYLHPTPKGQGDEPDFDAVQRDLTVQLSNVRATTQRLLNRPGRNRTEARTALAVSTFAHRLHDAIVVLAGHSRELHGVPPPEALDPFVTRTDETLDDLARAAEAGSAPGDLPDLDTALGSIRSEVLGATGATQPEGPGPSPAQLEVIDYGVVVRELSRVVHAVNGIALGLGEQDASETPTPLST